ncbi:Hypothetical protein DHA2_154225 [Giardia duodenalis]|uniref:Uncharacterized protein n=1 Tax=Giardia intestinalis TaxID=5741 RepID=V6T7Y1_GIAIN|nr:Hypothetical protein DHA2_154225 [Giardia intestinalis]
MLIHQGARMIASIEQAGTGVALPAIRDLDALVGGLEDSSNTVEQAQSKSDPDPEKARRRIANRVNNALSFGAVAKALRALDDTPMVDIKSEKAKAALSALHPCVPPKATLALISLHR